MNDTKVGEGKLLEARAFSFAYKVDGDRVSVRVFVGVGIDQLLPCGNLTFQKDEWEIFAGVVISGMMNAAPPGTKFCFTPDSD